MMAGVDRNGSIITMNDRDDRDCVFRSGPEECAYLRRRAEQHRQLSEKCQEDATRGIHLRLAQLYCDRVRLLDLVLPN